MADRQRDNFAYDRLPPRELWPELIFDLPELRYPERLNCAVALLDDMIAAGAGNRACFIGDDAVWTYAEVAERVGRLANVLKARGMTPGSRVLLRGPNNPMMMVCWLAVERIGAIAVATMPLLRARELAVVMEQAQIDLALCDHRLTEELERAAGMAKSEAAILVFGDAQGALEGAMREASPACPPADTAADDIALIAFTSGSTGKPKGCIHFHRDVLAIADTFSKHVLKPVADDIFCGSPPIAFTFGLGGLLIFPMRVGAATVLTEVASPEMLLKAIEKHKVTVCFTAPTAYRAMLGLVDKYDMSSLRRCVSAGEPLPLQTRLDFKTATGIDLIDGIGGTEMLHIFISAADDAIRPGATGRPVPGFRAAILDEDGRELPPGSVGRLAVKGPLGCRYLDDPRQTTYVQHGWNLTGDTYLMDEDGYFWFQARSDDMIVSAGYNISGPEVEDVLLEHRAIRECAVVASPDAARGFVAKAFVVLQPDVEGDESLASELQNFVKARIAPYKYPRAIAFVEGLPRTESGKLQRFRLRQEELQRNGRGV